jgi:hypothetical protein
MLERIREWGRRLLAGVVGDVPASVAACEFDCSRSACRHGRWESCPHRLEVQSDRREDRPDD